MAIPLVYNRTCSYVGTFDIFLRTLTTTYAPIQNGWRFLQGAPYPLTQWQRREAGNATFVTGVFGSLFDTANVHTDYALGSTADAFPVNNTSTAVWKDGRLFGWLDLGGAAQPITLSSFNYGLVPGTNRVAPLTSLQWEPRTGHTCDPAVLTNTNRALWSDVYGVGHRFRYTTAPNDINLGFLTGNNVYTPFVSAYVAAVAADPQPASLINIGPAYFANTNINVNNSPYLLLQAEPNLSNWKGITVTWDDPTINTEMQKSAGGFVDAYPSPFGWVSELNLTTAKGLTGFIVLTSPDCTTYQVLRIVPVDAQAQNWKGAVGQGYAMLDPGGVLWSHQINQDGIIYVSAGSVLRQLPIFPPVPLPPPPFDRQATLKAFR